MNTLPKAKKLEAKGLALSFDKARLKLGVKKLSDAVLKQQLKSKAEKSLLSRHKYPYQCFELYEENKDGSIIKHIPSVLKVDGVFEKLFEGQYIENIEKKVPDYIFRKILGYNDYFSSPVIIVRDRNGDVVDLVKYRPTREDYDHLPKYLQEKSKNKPEGRGESFLYLFQIEMEMIIHKVGYVFVGEGLKNALNALIRSIPFISIESTSNAANNRIVEYINKLFQKGIRIYGAMDGDSAGKKAFDTMNELLNRPIINLIDFDSGKDFTDHLRKVQI